MQIERIAPKSDLITVLIGGLEQITILTIVEILAIRLGTGEGINASALSGTYGSVSAVTFVTAITYISSGGQNFDEYMSAVLVVMEFPAIFMALFLVKNTGTKNLSNFENLKTAFLEVPNIILISSLLAGYLINKNSISSLNFFTITIFDYVLYIFLFVMGTRVAKRIGELKGKGASLVGFALTTPLVGSLLALVASINFDLSIGNSTLLMVLTASASYIAVPAVVKDAIPSANPAIYLGLSLGVTFPFNIIIGIPLYNELAIYFLG